MCRKVKHQIHIDLPKVENNGKLKKHLPPAIYDLSFGLFDTISANALIIFPYLVENDGASLYSEEYFENNFPLAWLI